MSIKPGFPVAGDGYHADVKTKGNHLRLFAEVYSLGYLAVVFDVNTNQKVAREDATSFEDAKKKAESLAALYLYYRGTVGELPPIEWNLGVQSRLQRPDKCP